MMDTSSLNLKWSYLIIDQLIQHQINYFCVGPGSRSTPLSLAVTNHPEAQHCVHFDERGLAFHALGYANATALPAVLIVTSGTDVANLLPAIIEACNQRIPLIILTADRPHELRDCGANQTCDQIKLFANHVRWQVDLPTPTAHIKERFISTTIAQAIQKATGSHPGPVHLNCPFREPLFSLMPISPPIVRPTFHEETQIVPTLTTIKKWADLFQNTQRGIFIIGSLPSHTKIEPILKLASLLNWPILPDILSQVRNVGNTHEIIRYYDALLKANNELYPHHLNQDDLVIHIGDRIVSKTLALWLKSISPYAYLQITENPSRQDPDHLITEKINVNPSLFCAEILPLIQKKTYTHWLDSWKLPSEKIANHFEAIIKEKFDLTEPGITHSLSKSLSSKWGLFLGNSMPIRDADQFLFPDKPIGSIFANRGVAGIDGNIATSIGIAQGIRKPTLALLGDLTFLHDLNSLAQIRQAQYPVIFLIINNHGGALFSFLPIAQRKDVLEEFFIASHPYHFQYAAELFQIPYFKPNNMNDWEHLFKDLLANPCSVIIEIQTNRTENLHFHQHINQSIIECLHTPLPVT